MMRENRASPHRHGRVSPPHLNVPLVPRHTDSWRTTNNPAFSGRAPEDNEQSVLVRKLAGRQRTIRPCQVESQKTTNNSSFSGRAPEDTWESSGELRFSVSPRTHRRGLSLRRACPNKSTKFVNTRCTLENDGEPSVSAFPHRHRRASSAQKISPQSRR